MAGTSQGIAHPDEEQRLGTTISTVAPHSTSTLTYLVNIDAGQHDVSAAILDAQIAEQLKTFSERVVKITTLNDESNQIGSSWSIPVPSAVQARIPAWTSQHSWQRQVRVLLNSPVGEALCRQHEIGTEPVFAVAVTMAMAADARTGRRVTISIPFIMRAVGISRTHVKRARRVLSGLGMAIETVRGRKLTAIEHWAAEAHHGGYQSYAASVWTLTSPQEAVTAAYEAEPKIPARPKKTRKRRKSHPASYPQSSTPGPLSSGSLVTSLPSVRKVETTREREASKTSTKTTTSQNPTTSRPLHLQRAAATLALAPAFHLKSHIGSLADVLAAHIDTSRWSGPDIVKVLNKDTKDRNWAFPTRSQLKHPLRFLAYRLREIDWSQPTPSEVIAGREAIRVADQARRDEECRQRDANAAPHSSPARRQALAALRAQLEEKAKSSKLRKQRAARPAAGQPEG